MPEIIKKMRERERDFLIEILKKMRERDFLFYFFFKFNFENIV